MFYCADCALYCKSETHFLLQIQDGYDNTLVHSYVKPSGQTVISKL